MLKGLAITPPVVGRISIGRVIERNGKRLPEKDDQFTLTSQVQNREGWLLHPLDEKLRKTSEGQKLRSIPVRLLFNDPALNLRADYSLFNRENGRPVCVGNGETCRRTGKEGMENLPCPGPDACAFAKGDCKAYARLNVVVGDGEDDALGSFVLRTTSYNTIRTLAARLHYFNAVSGGRLSCLPLELKLRGKSTTMSYRSAIYYVDEEQKRIAEQTIADVDASGQWDGKVVTEVEPVGDLGSPPFSRTLTRRPIQAMRSVHVEAKEVQRRVQAWRG